MSLFGKFMAILNFFGVIAVLVMALLVYTQRKVWQYAVYRHDLAMYGFPLTEEDMDEQDYYRYLDLGSPTGRTFRELGMSPPVTTQVKEVERVKSILDSKMAAVNDNRTLQMNLLAGTLLPLSLTNSQREFCLIIQTHCRDDNTFKALHDKMQAAFPRAVASVKADPKNLFKKEFILAMRFPGPVPNKLSDPPKGIALQIDPEPRDPFEEAFSQAIQPDPNLPPNLARPFEEAFNEAVEAVREDLKRQYNLAFEEALQGKHSGADGKTVQLNPEQRRHAIARLLVSLDDSLPKDEALNADAFNKPEFKRVLTLIGIQEMNRELNAEAAILARISQEQDKAIERERIDFVNTHQALITEAHYEAQRIAQQNDQVTELDAKYKAQKSLADAREKNVNDSKAELDRRRQYTREMIAIVGKMTESIHTTRVEVRDANAINQQNVEKIKELESKR